MPVSRSSAGLPEISSAQVILSLPKSWCATITKFQNVSPLTDAIAILLVCFRTVAPAWILNSTLMHLILVPQSSALVGHPQCHPGARQNLPTRPSQTQHVSGIPGLWNYF